MSNFQVGKPSNYESLKKQANDKNSWRNRLSAVEELGKWKCRESIDILWRRMINDDVYQVQEIAFRKLQAFGEDVKLPRKKKGNLIKDITKKLQKVKRALPLGHSFEDFISELEVKHPIIYDTYEGDRGKEKANKFFENQWKQIKI